MEEDFSNVIGKFQDIMKKKNIDLNSILNSSNNSSSNTENTDKSSSDFNLDINTILKMKQIFDKMNNNNNPRNNLLLSLKPFSISLFSINILLEYSELYPVNVKLPIV